MNKLKATIRQSIAKARNEGVRAAIEPLKQAFRSLFGLGDKKAAAQKKKESKMGAAAFGMPKEAVVKEAARDFDKFMTFGTLDTKAYLDELNAGSGLEGLDRKAGF